MTKIRKKIGNIPINEIEQQVQQSVTTAVGKMQQDTSTAVNQMKQDTSTAVNQMKQDVSDFIEEETAQYPEIGGAFKFIDDPEMRSELTLDSSNRVVSYRKEDGTKVENVGIETDKIKLTKNGIDELYNDFKNNGYVSKIDWSDDKFVELPIPEVCAIVNIISDDSTLPKTESVTLNGYLQYWDKLGNYFKKPIKDFAIQGDSSKVMPEKNYKFDFDDGSSVKFGNWVSQDSFHLKKYYMDNFRGQCVVAYKLAEQVYQSREFDNKKPYQYLYKNESTQNSNGKISEDFYTGAMCHPDGFPIKLFHNNVLVGIYSFNLKKHRDVYAMNKKKTNHILLDGVLSAGSIWDGNIRWTSFELKNPKPKLSKDGWELVDVDGNTYDGDNPKELMGTSTPGYDPSNNSHKKSAETKAIIERVSEAIPLIRPNLPSSSDDEETKEQKLANARQIFETYFKKDEIIDYYIYGNVVYDCDGFGKNWIWCTWDGLLWSPTYYDKDSIFGLIPATGLGIEYQSLTQILHKNVTNDPAGIASILYKDEIDLRYKHLRDHGIYTSENIVSLLENWINTIGYDNLSEELEKTCPETPSYRKNNLYDGWTMQKLEDKSLPEFDPEKTYQEGERCWYRYMTIIATKEIQPHQTPIEDPYSLYPQGGGFYNSVQRVYNWLNQRFSLLDSEFNYTNQ